jgi:hypothetical protein
VAKPVFTRSVAVEISVGPTIEELALAIIDLGSDEQAELISKIAELADFNIPTQLQYVTDDLGLTRQGRALMQLIGDYSGKFVEVRRG